MNKFDKREHGILPTKTRDQIWPVLRGSWSSCCVISGTTAEGQHAWCPTASTSWVMDSMFPEALPQVNANVPSVSLTVIKDLSSSTEDCRCKLGNSQPRRNHVCSHTRCWAGPESLHSQARLQTWNLKTTSIHTGSIRGLLQRWQSTQDAMAELLASANGLVPLRGRRQAASFTLNLFHL